MKVLIACEFSGRVREAFRKLGVEAYSCDILPAEDGSPFHIQADVRNILNDGWDLMIAHPPCIYLCNSGVRWLHERPWRWRDLEKAIRFFLLLINTPVPYIAVENPVMHKYALRRIGKPAQYIQPYWFGDPISKRTGLWLKNLPPLKPTHILPKSQVKQSIWLEPPSKGRWKNRSRTPIGFATAMASQWSSYLRQNL